MRFPRTIGTSLLAGVASTILVFTLACKHETHAIVHVDVAAQGTYPVLLKGQVIKWEGALNGSPYSIVWQGGITPCKDALPHIPSQNIDGVETVICEVENPPAAGNFVSYGVGPHDAEQRIMDGVQPCYGCTYYSDSSDLIAVKKGLAVGAPVVNVSCAGQIKLDPSPNQLSGTRLKWASLADVTINSLTFPAGSNVACSASAPYSCDFSSAVGNSWTYTLAATGSGTTQCGAGSSAGSIQGVVTK